VLCGSAGQGGAGDEERGGRGGADGARLLLEFLSKFESKFLSQVIAARCVTWRLRADSVAVQDFFENRDIFNSLELGWELLQSCCAFCPPPCSAASR
jgi:hypothetical protein